MSECCICLIELDNSGVIKLECCNNYIHELCNDDLINNKIYKCPLCRKKFNYEIIEMEPNQVQPITYIDNSLKHILIIGLALSLLIILMFLFYSIYLSQRNKN